MASIPSQAPAPSAASRLRSAARLACAGIALAALSACSSVSLDEPLEGTPWRLTQLDGQQVMFGADPKIDPTIQFDAGTQRVSGSGGCNNLSGGYRRSGNALRIGPLASTRKACIDADRSRLEGRFLAALEATAGYTVKGGQLTLLDGRSMPLAVLDLGLRTAPPP
ncbi:META domain-containing protein [Variovorax sp. dw_308]|uniref:META domain-containing protein n=1 Tax=Variovorax sp. dw_308 TaxID=2721546 RepID=UPI001C4556FA|nr:META domain-containing protein [Variovorax sp. dw_308]